MRKVCLSVTMINWSDFYVSSVQSVEGTPLLTLLKDPYILISAGVCVNKIKSSNTAHSQTSLKSCCGGVVAVSVITCMPP